MDVSFIFVKDEGNIWRKAGMVSSLGLTSGVAMLAAGAAGFWLDGKLGTAPLFGVVLFLGAGVTALWYGIVRLLK